MSAIEEINAKVEALKAEYEKAVKSIRDNGLGAVFKEFFDANPDVKGITWKQWIPGFNDGDPCTFTLGEILLTKNADDLEDWSSADEYDEDGWQTNNERIYVNNSDEGWHYEPNSNFIPDLKPIEKFINNNEELIESLFGSDAAILVTPEKITVEEYYCGY